MCPKRQTRKGSTSEFTPSSERTKCFPFHHKIVFGAVISNVKYEGSTRNTVNMSHQTEIGEDKLYMKHFIDAFI
uniref:Uncharacterized protein n=1 Tax=Wuchereria bancrofti TaxID=6293 RepID=A0AAF5PSN5_WUCBA